MKIGIIVLSYTGNTYSAANKLSLALKKEGRDIEIRRIGTESTDPNSPGGKKINDAPDTQPFDIILFGAPVWAFSLSTVMKQYLAQIMTLQGKKVGCFVTQGLSKPWLGGNRALKQIKKICTDKGAVVFAEGVIHASSKDMEKQTDDLIKRMSVL